MKLVALYQLFLHCSGVTTDSRHCPANSLFIALKGELFNGNKFAVQALKDGCGYVVIDEPQYALQGDNRFIVVDDCLQTLQQLANYHRKQLGTRIIAITGTNGKTTTKELLAAVLSQSYQVLYTLGNLNNHIGVPLTLLRLKAEHNLAVIEMGANHPGEIKILCEIAEPDYGLITNVGKAHLEGFGSFEGVIKTKGELYEFLRKRGDATVFIDHSNRHLMDIADGLHLISYGTEDTYYVSGQVTGNAPYLTFEWKEAKEAKHHSVHTQLIGEYNLSNALAAVTIGCFFGVEPWKIDQALAAYTPQNNRSQLKQTVDNTLIIDAYNANPTSMLAALTNFHTMEAADKMLLLGEMRELGADSLAEHQKIVDFIEACGFEEVLLVGHQFAATHHSFRVYLDVQQLIKEFQAQKPHGKLILIKGSNGTKLAEVVNYL